MMLNNKYINKIRRQIYKIIKVVVSYFWSGATHSHLYYIIEFDF